MSRLAAARAVGRMRRGQPLERRLEPAGGLVRGEARQRPSAGFARRGDRPLVLHAGGEPVVRELAEPRFAAERLQRLGDQEMQARALGVQQLAGERPVQQRVGEREALAAELGDEPGGHGVRQYGEHILLAALADVRQHVDVELAPDHRRDPQQPGGLVAEPRGPAGDDVAHHLGQLHRARAPP